MEPAAADTEPTADDAPAVPITAANEATLELGDGISLWYRTVRAWLVGILELPPKRSLHTPPSWAQFPLSAVMCCLSAQWGKRSGIPVLFVHGGPGNCVADYQNVNERFFDADVFFVVEVDQRGTGKSQPSVRQSEPAPQSYPSLSTLSRRACGRRGAVCTGPRQFQTHAALP